MAKHLRETVEKSLKAFITFLSYYKQGSDYEGKFNDLVFVSNPVSL